jgi:hypothetical protein
VVPFLGYSGCSQAEGAADRRERQLEKMERSAMSEFARQTGTTTVISSMTSLAKVGLGYIIAKGGIYGAFRASSKLTERITIQQTMLIQPPVDRWRYRNNQEGQPKDQQHRVDHVPHFLAPQKLVQFGLDLAECRSRSREYGVARIDHAGSRCHGASD